MLCHKGTFFQMIDPKQLNRTNFGQIFQERYIPCSKESRISRREVLNCPLIHKMEAKTYFDIRLLVIYMKTQFLQLYVVLQPSLFFNTVPQVREKS